MGPDLMQERVPHVRIENVRKSYGGLEVLKGVSFEVARGEAVVLLGPSGCGKSTLLRCINGLETIDGGGINVGGIDVGSAKGKQLLKLRLSAGLVFQNFNLFPHMTVMDNLTLAPRKLLGMSKEEARAIGADLLRRVGIPEKEGVYPSTLSGGQRQRVAIARALAMKPSLMLFDEPTSALDPEMREEVLAVIRSLKEEDNITMVVVTHEIGFGRDVADRAILMDAGHIVESGEASVVFRNPQSDRAKKFLKSIINA